MLNLLRLPIGGRNFETFSEYPVLTGILATALVRGIQRTGTGACPKAIAANAQQKYQRTHSADMNQRTLHELYLRHFAYIVRQARPAALMTSYNKVNGVDTSTHSDLIRRFLREELGVDGIVISDWGGVHGSEVVATGLDLEMPGPPAHVPVAAVRATLERGELTTEELDERATRLLEANLAHAPRPEQPAAVDTPEHRLLARELAEAAITLLKNEDDILPLVPAHLRHIAVIGPNAADDNPSLKPENLITQSQIGDYENSIHNTPRRLSCFRGDSLLCSAGVCY